MSTSLYDCARPAAATGEHECEASPAIAAAEKRTPGTADLHSASVSTAGHRCRTQLPSAKAGDSSSWAVDGGDREHGERDGREGHPQRGVAAHPRSGVAGPLAVRGLDLTEHRAPDVIGAVTQVQQVDPVWGWGCGR